MIRDSVRGMVIAVTAIVLAGACAATVEGTGDPPIFYPSPPAEPRLQLLGSFSQATDIEEQSSFREFVVGEEAVRSVQKAYGVAWRDDKLYVCDSGPGKIDVFDFETRQMRTIATAASGLLKKPIDIAIAPDGWKYVTDTGHRRVLVFGADDAYREAFGDPETWKPSGVAANADTLYVTDLANHCLVLLDRKTGAERKRIGKQGAAEGEFYFPLSVTLGREGDIYVTDCFNCRIQRFRPDGTYVRSYGSMGTGPGQFARPRACAVDRDGRLYVTDAAFENVQIFDAEGKLLLYFGGPGSGPGAMNLPASVKIDYSAAAAFEDRAAPGYDVEYVLFVTSQTGPNKVNVYGFLKKD